MNRSEAYSILGVSPGASNDEVKKAYRRLAMKWHPDRNKEPNAEEQFKLVKQAYELISSGKESDTPHQGNPGGQNRWQNASSFTSEMDMDDLKDFLRRFYDSVGTFRTGTKQDSRPRPDDISEEYSDNWSARGPGSASQGQQRRHQVLNIQIAITLDEGFTGCVKQLQIPDMKTISGTPVYIKIPAGISDNELIKVFETANTTVKVYARIISPKYETLFDPYDPSRNGDIFTVQPVSALTMITGGFIQVTTLDGSKISVRVPAGMQAGKLLKIKEKGYWRDSRAVTRADCFLQVIPVFAKLEEYPLEEVSKLMDTLNEILNSKKDEEKPNE